MIFKIIAVLLLGICCMYDTSKKELKNDCKDYERLTGRKYE